MDHCKVGNVTLDLTLQRVFNLTIVLIVCVFQDGMTSVNNETSCSSEWKYHDEHCYRVFISELEYGDAVKACQTFTSTLASVKSAEVHLFLGTLIDNAEGRLSSMTWLSA